MPWPAVRFAASWTSAALFLALAFYAAWSLVKPQLAKPYTYDEAAFAFAGHAVAETGLPYSNVGHIQEETPGDFSRRFNWAIWHPPLYLYLLGYAYRQWGESETTARTVGVVCSAITALVVFASAALLLTPRTRAAPLFGALGAAIFLLNPLVQQNALLLDIDGTVLVASIALLCFAYLLLLRSSRPLRSPVTALLLGLTVFCFALSLWAKMTTALALVAVATVYRLLAARPWHPWRVLVELPVVALGGGALFLGTWFAVSTWQHLPFWFPFRILQLEFAEAAGSTSGWRENPWQIVELVGSIALWISPYLLGLFLWAGLARLYDLVAAPAVALARRAMRRPAAGQIWGLQPVDFALACGGAIGLAYLIKLAASFPKYHISMMPFWGIVVAYLLARYVRDLSWWEPPVWGIVLAGMAGYFTSFVGDQYVLYRGWSALGTAAIWLLLWPALLGLAFLVLSVTLGRHHLPRQLAILAVLLTLAWSFGVDLAQAQADYSTSYNYGTAGQKEAAAYLNTILKPDEPHVAPREVAYYTRDQVFVDQDVWWARIEDLSRRGITVFDGRLLDYDVHVVTLFLWDPNLGQIAHTYLDPKYEVAFQSLPYVVFVKTSN